MKLINVFDVRPVEGHVGPEGGTVDARRVPAAVTAELVPARHRTVPVSHDCSARGPSRRQEIASSTRHDLSSRSLGRQRRMLSANTEHRQKFV